MGGSGGGGRNLNTEELRALEKVARETLKDASGPEKRNIFISFSSKDLNEVNLLRGQAKNENSDIEFNDRSLIEPFNSEKADYIKRGICERIRQASVTVVYLTDNSARSEWVDWEVRESIRLGKGVVGMYSGDSPPSNLPPVVKELGVPLVPWRQKQFNKAIEKGAQKRLSES